MLIPNAKNFHQNSLVHLVHLNLNHYYSPSSKKNEKKKKKQCSSTKPTLVQ